MKVGSTNGRFVARVIAAAVGIAFAFVFARPASAALLVQYTFDDGNANDSSGNNRHGTVVGGAFITDAERGAVLEMQMPLQDEAVGYLALAVPSTTGSYTFATWYKGTDTKGYFFDNGDSSNRLTLSMGQNTTGGTMGVFVPGSWTSSAVTSAAWVGEWMHIAWVLENNGLGVGADSLSIYINGVAQDVDPAAGVQTKLAIPNIPALSTAGNQRFFNHNNHPNGIAPLSGRYDDVRIYDHALSASEVYAIVPEPATFGIVLGALAAVVIRRRRMG